MVGPHGFPTVVKQVAKFQNYNLSTFKFQCSPAWRSCSCWRCSNFARPTGFRHVGEVAFSTLLRSESRTLPDNPPLSENGAKKDRLRAERGRPFCLWKASASRQRPRKTKPARQYRTTGRERLFFRECLAEDVDQNTSSNGRADNTGHVGAHGVHQQEVLRVLALAHLLGHTGGHRHSGNASGTDQRVDLAAGHGVHHLAAQHTGCGAEGEGDQAQHDDEQGAGVQEGVCRGGAANRQSQENGDDVKIQILGKFPQSVGIEQTDLCIILANSLDNVKEAFSRFEGKKELGITIQNHKKRIILKIENTSQPVDVKNINTSKKDKKNHGYGISNIRRVVDKYNGTMQIKYVDGRFLLEMLI